MAEETGEPTAEELADWCRSQQEAVRLRQRAWQNALAIRQQEAARQHVLAARALAEQQQRELEAEAEQQREAARLRHQQLVDEAAQRSILERLAAVDPDVVQRARQRDQEAARARRREETALRAQEAEQRRLAALQAAVIAAPFAEEWAERDWAQAVERANRAHDAEVRRATLALILEAYRDPGAPQVHG